MDSFQISHSENRDHLSATLKHEGKDISVSAEGAGVVESFVSGLSDLVGEELVLVDYSEHAVTSSANSEAACYVQMNINGQRFSGVGLSRDIVDASLQAILCAVNNYIRGG